MGFVALAFAETDTDLGLELRTLLENAGLQARPMPTTSTLGGGASATLPLELDRADVVLMLWSQHAEYSPFLAMCRAHAARQRKLLMVRLDDTPMPRDTGAVVVDLRGRDLARAVDAIRSAVSRIGAPKVLEQQSVQPSAARDAQRPAAPAATAEPDTVPPRMPGDWDPFAAEAPDRTVLKPPSAREHPDSRRDARTSLPAPSRHLPDFVDTRADSGVDQDVALSRSTPAPVRSASPTLFARLKTLGARAIDVLGGGRVDKVPRSAPDGVLRNARPGPVDKPVLLAASAPRCCAPGTSFTAALVAYVAASREPAIAKLAELGEAGDRRVVDVGTSMWAVGAPVCVRISAPGAAVFPPEIRFDWNGNENLAAFSVTPSATSEGHLQIGFQVFVADVMVTFIPMRVGIGSGDVGDTMTKAEVPRSAFASYSSRDAENVTQRLSTLCRWTRGLDIFQDCLDLNPGETFKPRLARQIADRDVFLLFWSRQAAMSPWVKWEYTTALGAKDFAAILPMPLEDPAIAPPPAEFADLHLRDRFMLAGYALAKVREEAGRP